MNEINDNKKAMSEDVKQALIRFNKDNIYVQNLKIELVDMSLGYVKGKMMVTEDVLISSVRGSRSARARRCHCTRQIFTMTRDSL